MAIVVKTSETAGNSEPQNFGTLLVGHAAAGVERGSYRLVFTHAPTSADYLLIELSARASQRLAEIGGVQSPRSHATLHLSRVSQPTHLAHCIRFIAY
jgi:hypothetical protein